MVKFKNIDDNDKDLLIFVKASRLLGAMNS